MVSPRLLPQAWHFFVQSTPGDANGTGASDLGPLITGAFHLPALPATTDDIVVDSPIPRTPWPASHQSP